MTYKSIIENMIRVKATHDVEKIINDHGVNGYVFERSTTTKKDINFGISFEIAATINNHNISISGYVDEYGGVNVCTIWKYDDLIYSISHDSNKFELLA